MGACGMRACVMGAEGGCEGFWWSIGFLEVLLLGVFCVLGFW